MTVRFDALEVEKQVARYEDQRCAHDRHCQRLTNDAVRNQVDHVMQVQDP